MKIRIVGVLLTIVCVYAAAYSFEQQPHWYAVANFLTAGIGMGAGVALFIIGGH